MTHARPEILAPAGCLQRLKTAVAFGADAVYVGGARFSLRKQADNLNEQELRQGVAYAHARGAKVYVTCNVMPLQRDWAGLASYAQMLQSVGPDAVIVSDPGVAHHFLNETSIRVHVSTQASVTNTASAATWRARGAQRIVLAREVDMVQAAAIQRDVGVEVECFVHGAMCASFSGKCVISNYTAGRDANRGGCMQTCRYQFDVHNGREVRAEPDYSAPIMNARDLMALSLIPRFRELGIHACKIEGRMKSALYVAATASAYRQAAEGVALADNAAAKILPQLSNRTFTSGGLEQRPYSSSINSDFDGYTGGVATLGQAIAWDDARGALVPLRTDLKQGDEVCWLLPSGQTVRTPVTEVIDNGGNTLHRVSANRAVWIPSNEEIPALSVAWLERDPSKLNFTGGRSLPVDRPAAGAAP